MELQSITTLEATASGLPIIAARAGALPELVEDGINGYLVDPSDIQGFARAMATVLANPEANETMGRASRKQAERHAIGAVAHAHEALLASAIDRRLATLQA